MKEFDYDWLNLPIGAAVRLKTDSRTGKKGEFHFLEFPDGSYLMPNIREWELVDEN